MGPSAVSPRMWQVISAVAAVVVVVIAALQVGSGREFLVMAAVGAVALALLAIAAPQVLIVMGAAMVFASFAVAGIPFSDLGAALIILGAVCHERNIRRYSGTLFAVLLVLLTWTVIVATANLGDPAVSKRLLSLSLWALLVGVVALASETRSLVAWGLLVGLIVSPLLGAVLGFGYGSRLGGLIGDPNTFAMVVVVSTPLVVDQLRLASWRAAGVWLWSSVLVVAADSRSGMLALATAAVVYALLPRLRAWAIAVPALALLAANSLPDDVVRAGRWEERAGSDALREEIDAAASRQIAESPWTGHGLGSGKVDLAVYGEPPTDLTFLLHNSYKSMVTEMGLIGLSFYAILAVGAIAQGLRGVLARGALAAISAAAVMSTQLGEVLFAIPLAIAFGFAWGSETRKHPGIEEVSYQSVASPSTLHGKSVTSR